MTTNLHFALIAATLATLVCSSEALPSGGVVKLKTDNGPDGYSYNALGLEGGRYVSYYTAGEFESNAIICGTRYRDTYPSLPPTPTLVPDLRFEDPNCPGYADLSVAGLIATADANSFGTCSRGGLRSTATFGGGAGIADPRTNLFVTLAQPSNFPPSAILEFCGILLDTSSVFVNSARTQSYGPGGVKSSIGFNHFVEAIVFEPKLKDLNVRMTGSSRFPGDRGLPILFARRVCDHSESNCVRQAADFGPISTTDDFITARVTMDNNTASPCSVHLSLSADRTVINPKLTPKDVTGFFRICGSGVSIMNPLALPANSRTNLCLEIKTAIGRGLLGAFPVDLPFIVRIADPNDAVRIFDRVEQNLGIREVAGAYDNNTEAGGYFFTQNPVQTGDNVSVRFDAIDLQNRANTPTPYRLSGLQYVSGEFGASGLAGTDAVELRVEDPIFPGSPDLSPSGLLRQVGTVGDPGNPDGIPSGPPPTTTTSDFTDVVLTPGNLALAINVFGMVYLNPGETSVSVTAIGATGGGDVFIGNSQSILCGVLPVSLFTQNDLEIRLDMEGELGLTSPNLGGQRGKSISTLVRTHGQFIAIDKNRNRRCRLRDRLLSHGCAPHTDVR